MVLDIVSLIPNIWAIVCDVNNRLDAPRRLAERTEYIDRRDQRLQDLLQIIRSVDDAPTISRQAATAPPSKVPGAPKQRTNLARGTEFVQQFAHRDASEAKCNDRERKQNHAYLDSILKTQVEDQVKNHIRFLLKNCTSLSAAYALRNCPNVELESLELGDRHNYYAIFKPDTNGAPLPRWGLAPVSPELLATPELRKRLLVVLDVATALHTAHQVEWYHRHLSTDNIVIRNTDNRAKVLKFLCPVTFGCFHCRHCQNTWKKENHENPHLIESLRTMPKKRILFSTTHRHPYTKDGGERADVVSFAAFVLWFYSAEMLDNDETSADMSGQPGMDRVPWPLRWIICYRHHISMAKALTFLQALHSGLIEPHDMLPRLVSPSRTQNNENAFTSDLLLDACKLSSLAGVRTNEPQAALNLARMYEKQFKQASNDSLEALELAIVFYRKAAKFGELTGFLHVARILADQHLNSARREHIQENSTPVKEAVSFLLQAAVQGSAMSLHVLQVMVKQDFKSAFNILNDNYRDTEYNQELPSVNPDALLDAMVAIGKSWRRGQNGLPVCYELAYKWLQEADVQGRPDATLELGLLKVQIAKNRADMEEGVRLVRRASNTLPHKAAHAARYWLGVWYFNGLTCAGKEDGMGVDTDSKLVVAKDATQALWYIRKAAEVGHADAMVLYGRFHRMGFGYLTVDQRAAERWNSKAIEKKSVAAICSYAMMLAEIARKEYHAMVYGRDHSKDGEDTKAGPVDLKRCSTGSTCSYEGSETSSAWYKEPVKYTPERVDTILSNALEALKIIRSRFKGVHMEQYNPKPPFLGARIIMENMDIWAVCASSVRKRSSTKKEFCAIKRSEAIQLLKKAEAVTKTEQWRRLRVDYFRVDIQIAMEARNIITRLEE